MPEKNSAKCSIIEKIAVGITIKRKKMPLLQRGKRMQIDAAVVKATDSGRAITPVPEIDARRSKSALHHRESRNPILKVVLQIRMDAGEDKC